jgi:hypothetical protein
MVGGMTYGAKKEVRLQLFEEALALQPGSAIGMVDYANALVMLEGDERIDEATALYAADLPADGRDGRAARGHGTGRAARGKLSKPHAPAATSGYLPLTRSGAKAARGDFEQAVKDQVVHQLEGRVMLGAIFQPAPPVMMQAGSWPLCCSRCWYMRSTAPAMA